MEKRETGHGPAAWPGMIVGGNSFLVLAEAHTTLRHVQKGGSVCFERLKKEREIREEREKPKRERRIGGQNTRA